MRFMSSHTLLSYHNSRKLFLDVLVDEKRVQYTVAAQLGVHRTKSTERGYRKYAVNFLLWRTTAILVFFLDERLDFFLF